MSCEHSAKLENWAEGTVVCLDCGLVLDQIFVDGVTHPRQETNENLEKMNRLAQEFIFNNMLDESLLQKGADLFSDLFAKHNVELKRIKISEKNMLIYCLIDVMTQEAVPYNVDMMYEQLGGSRKTYWKIFNLHRSAHLSKPEHFMNYYCWALQLSYKDYSNLMVICTRYEYLDMQPTCLAAGIVYRYCRDMKKNISMKSVSEVLHVSKQSIQKFLRRDLIKSYEEVLEYCI